MMSGIHSNLASSLVTVRPPYLAGFHCRYSSSHTCMCKSFACTHILIYYYLAGLVEDIDMLHLAAPLQDSDTSWMVAPVLDQINNIWLKPTIVDYHTVHVSLSYHKMSCLLLHSIFISIFMWYFVLIIWLNKCNHNDDPTSIKWWVIINISI